LSLAAVARQIFDSPCDNNKRRRKMLWTIALILVVLWLLGFVTSYTLGGFIHVLLVIAVIVIVVQLLQGRRG